MNRFRNLLRLPQNIPTQYRSNFSHLAGDFGWYGVLNGSTVAFLAIYATRLGASGLEIGLLNAAPAIISLVFALPSSRWLESQPAGQSVFWTSILSRVFYLLFIPLPFILKPAGEVWAIILITFIMTVPSIANTVGFFNLFAEAVPSDWRGYVAGVRNAIFSIVTIIVSLLCGQILIRVPFPTGYQIVFGLGVFGAAMSSYHLWWLRHIVSKPKPLDAIVNPGVISPSISPHKIGIRLTSPFDRVKKNDIARFSIIKGPFGKIVLLLFSFHLAQYLGIPLFPLYTVNQVHFTDQTLSIGLAVFNLMVFIGSLQLAQLTSRLGNRRLIGLGILIVSLYPILLSMTRDTWMYVFTSMVGGSGWSLVNGVLYNYLLEKVPVGPRPVYLAWYNVGLNAAILVGSLTGPELVRHFGFTIALVVCGVGRFISGIAILRWGD